MFKDDNQLDDFFGLKSDSKEGVKKDGIRETIFKNTRIAKIRLLPKVLSSKERYLVIIFLLIIIVSLISIPFTTFYHFTKATPDYGGSFSEGIVGEPHYINPLLSQGNDVDRDLVSLVYSSLMKYNKEGKLVPDLVKSYDISGDGLNYTIYLKENAKWHDGISITADDVVFTVQTAQNPDFASLQRINWQSVDVEAVNEYTVILKLKNKYAQFLNNLTLNILPRHIWENVKPVNFALSDFNLKPIGSGPYKFKKLKKDSNGSTTSYELTAYENYHGQKPFIKNLTFKFFNSEDELVQAYNSNVIEGIGFLSTEKIKNLKFSQKLSPQKIRLPRYFAAFFNQNQSKVLTDKNIRLALNYATDKQELLDKVLDQNGLVINSPILKELTQQETAQKYAYDKEFAKQILENSGWKDSDGDGFREKEPAKKSQTEPKNEAVIEIKTSHSSDL